MTTSCPGCQGREQAKKTMRSPWNSHTHTQTYSHARNDMQMCMNKCVEVWKPAPGWHIQGIYIQPHIQPKFRAEHQSSKAPSSCVSQLNAQCQAETQKKWGVGCDGGRAVCLLGCHWGGHVQLAALMKCANVPIDRGTFRIPSQTRSTLGYVRNSSSNCSRGPLIQSFAY